MDNVLIDSLLGGLFDIPREDRTADDVKATLLFVAEAAGIQLDDATSLQLEQLKLTAAVRHLAAEVGADSYRVSLVTNSDRDPYLCCTLVLIEGDTQAVDRVQVFAVGQTAEQVLIDLRGRHALTGIDARAAA